MAERLEEAKKYVELYKESMNSGYNEDSTKYMLQAMDIINIILYRSSNVKEVEESKSLVIEMISAYLDAYPTTEKLISILSEKLSTKTCEDLAKLLLEDPYWLWLQHLGYGMTVRNMLREICNDFHTLEYRWEYILIGAIKRNLGFNEKLPLKCWLCKWNERCGDKVCQSVYYRVRPHPVTYEFYEFDDDLYEGSNGLTYEYDRICLF